MSSNDKTLTGKERFFDQNEIIVSKTDLKGRITYANDVFLKIADYTENEVLGQPHSLIRHPEMPRCIFKLLWESISNGEEIFAYVMNRTKFGDHYWVLAHVTPSRDKSGAVVGYHSNRRVPKKDTITNMIEPFYKELVALEREYGNRKDGLDASYAKVQKLVADQKMDLNEFILSL